MKLLYCLLIIVRPLRLLLMLLVALVIVAGPFAGGVVTTEGFGFVLSVLAPSLFAMLLFIIPLDITMMLVFRASTDDAAHRRRYWWLIWLQGGLLLALLLAWLPIVLRLLDRAPI